MFWVLGGCAQDPCDQLCVRTANRLRQCLAQWPAKWEDLDAKKTEDFRKQCQNRWAEVRVELEPRELDDAQDQCDETIQDLNQLSRDGTTCDVLRALYIY